MHLKFAVSLGSALLVLNIGAFAIDPERQALIDRYKEPFSLYLSAINDLGSALDSLRTETDLIKAADSRRGPVDSGSICPPGRGAVK